MSRGGSCPVPAIDHVGRRADKVGPEHGQGLCMRRAVVIAVVIVAVAVGGWWFLQGSLGATDPYLWLEDIHGIRALAWVMHQNARTLEDARAPIPTTTRIIQSSFPISTPPTAFPSADSSTNTSSISGATRNM